MELFFFHNPVRQLPKVICDSCCINSHLTSVRNTRDSLEICGHDQRLSQEGRPFLIGLSRSVRASSRLTGLQLVEKHFLLLRGSSHLAFCAWRRHGQGASIARKWKSVRPQPDFLALKVKKEPGLECSYQDIHVPVRAPCVFILYM